VDGTVSPDRESCDLCCRGNVAVGKQEKAMTGNAGHPGRGARPFL